ncbi:DUF6804 family protein [Sinomonas soli]
MAGFFLLVRRLGATYDFYWAVAAMVVWTAVTAGGHHGTGWAAVFVAIAVLFNPLVPFYSTRSFWAAADFGALIVFIVAAVKLKASKPRARARSATTSPDSSRVRQGRSCMVHE